MKKKSLDLRKYRDYTLIFYHNQQFYKNLDFNKNDLPSIKKAHPHLLVL